MVLAPPLNITSASANAASRHVKQSNAVHIRPPLRTGAQEHKLFAHEHHHQCSIRRPKPRPTLQTELYENRQGWAR